MLKFQISTNDDLLEEMRLQKRRQYEEDRKKRIFDAKVRLFGVDRDALDRQVEDKKKEMHTMAENEKHYQQQLYNRQHIIYSRALDEERDRRLAETDCNFYRCHYQRKEDRREFDLNDPDLIKKAIPARVADDDLRLGISSAQVFFGEDLGYEERRRRQRDQQRAWLDQQMKERTQADSARKKSEDTIRQSLLMREQMLGDVVTAENNIKQQLIDSVVNFNLDMAKKKQIDKERTKRQQREDDLAEIYNMLTSDMLTENPDVAQSRINPNKKIAYMYRGMTPSEVQEFRKKQHEQMELNKRRISDKNLAERQWEQYVINMDHDLVMKQIEIDRKKQENIDTNFSINAQLARQQRAAKEEEQIARRNVITKEYFNQFNKSTR